MDSSVLMDKDQEPGDSDLKHAKVYAEGRGIGIPVEDHSDLQDIFMLIKFKPSY